MGTWINFPKATRPVRGRVQVFPGLALWSSSPHEAFLLLPDTPHPVSKVAARVIHLQSKSLSLPCRVPGGFPVPTGLSSSPLPRLLLPDPTHPPCICLAVTPMPSTWCSVPCCSPEHPVSLLGPQPCSPLHTPLHVPHCNSGSACGGGGGVRVLHRPHTSVPLAPCAVCSRTPTSLSSLVISRARAQCVLINWGLPDLTVHRTLPIPEPEHLIFSGNRAGASSIPISQL